MPHRSFLILLLSLAAILIGERAPAAPGLAAGSRSVGWVLLPAGVPGSGGVLHMLPAGDEPGSIRRVYPIDERPEAIAASDSALVLVFPAKQGSTLHHVRQIDLQEVAGAGSALMVSEPEPLPPIDRAGSVSSLVLADSGPIALLARGHGSAGPPWTLLSLTGLSWTDRPLPPEAASASGAALVESGGRLVLLLSGPERGAVSMWTERVDDPSAPWQGHDLRAEPAPVSLIGCAGQIIDSFQSAPGERSIRLWRQDGASVVAVSRWHGAMDWLVATGPWIVHLWSEDSDSAMPRLDCRVFAPTGQVVYEGAARTLAPVNPQELFLLAVMLATIAVIVIAFVTRPSDSDRAAITLPQGTALASAGARIFATVIDGGLAVAGAAAIWRVPLGSALDVPGMLVSDGGWLLGTTILALWIIALGLCEWALGGSPGKRLLGLRTVNRRGGRVSPAQGIGRTAAKVLCPPLSALSFTVPSRLPPGSFGTLVVERTG